MSSRGTFWRAEVFPSFLVPKLENNSYFAHYLQGECPVSDVTAIVAPSVRMGGDTRLQCHRCVRHCCQGSPRPGKWLFGIFTFDPIVEKRGYLSESDLSPPAGQRWHSSEQDALTSSAAIGYLYAGLGS